MMTRLLGVIALLVAGVAGLGFYLGWFHFSRGGTDDKTNYTITVDQDKLRESKKKVQEKVQDVSRKGKDNNATPADPNRK
jgi:hypothetical protein